jgi:16S rRNA (guanine527-N7)-methyltransferase
LTPEAIAALLPPYVRADGLDLARICGQLASYLDLLQKWNAKLNLTAIRTPEEIVRRHFGESLFAGSHLGQCETLLDFGSGAGFPGLPIQLLRPDVTVTLAESQGKKTAFLREVVRTLGLATEVYAGRVESMAPRKQFDTVALRAVDNMEAAVTEAGKRAMRQVLILGASTTVSRMLSADFAISGEIPIPQTAGGVLRILRRN